MRYSVNDTIDQTDACLRWVCVWVCACVGERQQSKACVNHLACSIICILFYFFSYVCVCLWISAPPSAGHHRCVFGLWTLPCLLWLQCVCLQWGGRAPGCSPSGLLSNHVDRRGSCLSSVGVCRCGSAVVGLQVRMDAVFGFTSVSVSKYSVWECLRESRAAFMWSLNLATVSIIVFTVKLLPTSDWLRNKHLLDHNQTRGQLLECGNLNTALKGSFTEYQFASCGSSLPLPYWYYISLLQAKKNLLSVIRRNFHL